MTLILPEGQTLFDRLVARMEQHGLHFGVVCCLTLDLPDLVIRFQGDVLKVEMPGPRPRLRPRRRLANQRDTKKLVRIV